MVSQKKTLVLVLEQEGMHAEVRSADARWSDQSFQHEDLKIRMCLE